VISVGYEPETARMGSMNAVSKFASGNLDFSAPIVDTGCTRRLSWRLSDIWAAPLSDLPVRDEVIDQYIPLSPQMELLEVGPGCGFETFRLARSVKQLTVLDVAAGNIARLEKIFAARKNVRLVCADVCRPNLGSEIATRFDAIVAIEVFEYLTDPATALSNLARLLRPGSTLYLQFPNYAGRPGTYFFSARAELESLLAAAGFERWALHILRLRPWAEMLFRHLHEAPIRVYRSLRQADRPSAPQEYQETWAFHHSRQLERWKWAMHTYWATLILMMRAAGNVFEAVPAGSDILNNNLFLVAWKPRVEAGSGA
jgi:SAM-dependent methyltransferase